MHRRIVSKQVVLTLFYNRFSLAVIIKGVVELVRKKSYGMGVKFSFNEVARQPNFPASDHMGRASHVNLSSSGFWVQDQSKVATLNNLKQEGL